jgi:hypothetical protein
MKSIKMKRMEQANKTDDTDYSRFQLLIRNNNRNCNGMMKGISGLYYKKMLLQTRTFKEG